jgi:predicted RNase H-like nuclease (RuvC/YqgF family)
MALSNAERQRRYIERLKAKAASVTNGADASQAERIRELEREIERLTKLRQRDRTEIRNLKQQLQEAHTWRG